jgi:hypothetical protein
MGWKLLMADRNRTGLVGSVVLFLGLVSLVPYGGGFQEMVMGDGSEFSDYWVLILWANMVFAMLVLSWMFWKGRLRAWSDPECDEVDKARLTLVCDILSLPFVVIFPLMVAQSSFGIWKYFALTVCYVLAGFDAYDAVKTLRKHARS